MSFAGTSMNMETTILSKLTQEQKTKQHMFSLMSGNRTIRTHGHHTQGPVSGVRVRGGTALGEIPNVEDRLMGAANHHGLCISM